MPRKKKNADTRPKRELITDESGWTHIVTHRSSAQPKQPSSNALSINDDIPISVPELELQQAKIAHVWRTSQCCQQLHDILTQHRLLPSAEQPSIRLNKCVCLGLGSVSNGRLSSQYQFETLRWLLELFQLTPLASSDKHSTSSQPGDDDDDGHIQSTSSKVILQDPSFTSSDTAYLTSLGFTVVLTPQAFQLIDTHTLLFAPHLEAPVYAEALRQCEQRVGLCIGSDVTQYLDQAWSKEDVGDDGAGRRKTFARFAERMHHVPMPVFERDPWWTCTNVYFPVNSQDNDMDDAEEAEEGKGDSKN